MRCLAPMFAAALVASGCACQGTPTPADASPDVTEDARRRPRDAFIIPDAHVVPDAGPPFTLIERDPSPCPPIDIAPQRPRRLPADATPRVLWTASLAELGVPGMIPDQGAVDRQGGVHFSTAFFLHQGAELDREGLLLGFGAGIEGGDLRRFSPMAILPDDRAIEGSGDFLRIDASPPSPSVLNLVSFPVPEEGFSSGPFIATTSDGFYALRTLDSLRKYCADGRLQWEMPIGTANGILTEPDDSVWLFGSSNTAGLAVRILPNGTVGEWVRSSEEGHGSYVMFADDLRWVSTLSRNETTVLSTVERDGAVLYRLERSVLDAVCQFTPRGDLWCKDDNGGTPIWHRFENGEETSDVAEVPLSYQTLFGEDGSMMFTGGSRGSNELICLDPHGRVRWRVDLPHAAGYLSHDIDGRVYLYGGQHVMAVQTDVLPPAVRGCWSWRCNYLANNRLEEVHD
jgi:hypothetical protein